MSNVNNEHYYLKEYKIGEQIGKGSFATVYKGEHVRTGKSVAIKAVSRFKLSKKLQENLDSEISILKTLNHPHIVSLLDHTKTDKFFYLAMEYCSLGDLSYFIRHKKELSTSLPLASSLFARYPSKNGLHEDLARHFLKQLASALQFLRKQNFVHRDIKPQNLLLLPPKKTQQEAIDAGYSGNWELPVLKLADFGFARILPSTALADTLCGSPLYMAPEILNYQKYDAKADLWSVGAVIYELVVGRPPFQAANHVELLKNINDAKDQITFPSGNILSDEIKELICKLLIREPTKRASFQEFFNSPVLKDDLIEDKQQFQPLDHSKLDEKIFISEYIQGVPTTNQLPTPPNRSVSGSPEVIEKEDERSSSSPGSSFVNEKKIPFPQTSANVHPVTSYPLHTPPSNPVQSPQIHAVTHAATYAATHLPTYAAPTYSPNSPTHSHSPNVPPQSAKPDNSLEREYVVVEKRTVEVNILADELAYSPATKPSVSPVRAIMQNYNNNLRDRRLSIGYGSSPTNALSKALTMASARLFGTKVDSYGTTTYVSPPQFAQRPIPTSIESEERLLIKELETLATKAKVVNLFAEVKYSQLMPIDNTDRFMTSVIDDDDDIYTPPNNNKTTAGLNPEITAVIAEEALVLYVKTLSLLTKAMDKAGQWWTTNGNKGASLQLNDIVQWIRDKFNESLEKAEYAQGRVNDALLNQKRLNKVSLNITAEKLIFDRALEMSRAAAVNEQIGEDLEGCELSYGTSVWMLEALLVTDKQDEVLDDDDRAIVEKFISSISKRLSELRNRLEGIGHAQTPTLPIYYRRRTSSSSSSSSPSKYPPRIGQITEISSHVIED